MNGKKLQQGPMSYTKVGQKNLKIVPKGIDLKHL
jgi:hypothetical protein